jgi:hypothetical protein
LLIIYMRSDFAELLAVAIFPLLILATLRTRTPAHGGKSDPFEQDFARSAVLRDLSANAPAAVIASYSVAFSSFAALRQRSSRRSETAPGIASWICLRILLSDTRNLRTALGQHLRSTLRGTDASGKFSVREDNRQRA